MWSSAKITWHLPNLATDSEQQQVPRLLTRFLLTSPKANFLLLVCTASQHSSNQMSIRHYAPCKLHPLSNPIKARHFCAWKGPRSVLQPSGTCNKGLFPSFFGCSCFSAAPRKTLHQPLRRNRLTEDRFLKYKLASPSPHPSLKIPQPPSQGAGCWSSRTLQDPLPISAQLIPNREEPSLCSKAC